MADAGPPHYPESADFCSRLRLEHRALTSCAAALAALALHILLIAPVLWTGGTSRHPDQRKYRGDGAMQWVVLQDASGGAAGSKSPSLPLPNLTAIAVTDALPKLPLGAASPGASGAKSGQSESPSGFGEMSGRYLGQIHARIDRAWLRPRSAIGAPIFQCQAQIDQDRQGRVAEVTLLECNGDARWQVSLVRAIEAASPLPAPPDEAVFGPHVLLEFRAAAYSPGAPQDLYEPPPAARASLARADGVLPQNVFRALRDASRAHSGRAIELRIEGSKAEVEPERQ